MTIEEFCKEYDITEDQFLGREVINGSLDLYAVTELPDNFSPIVLNWLDMRSLKKLPISFNPQVGGCIFLNNDIICGDLFCEESIKENLTLMIKSDDTDICNLALSMLWKYRTEDIKEITKNKILFKLINS